MKQPILNALTVPLPGLLAAPFLACLVMAVQALAARGGEPPETIRPLGDREFRDQLRGLERSGDSAERAGRAMVLLREGRFSSLQIKALAKLVPQEDARFDFALAAYPRILDPENFYEVYDAFTSFSKVLRLHDQVQLLRASSEPSSGSAWSRVTDEAMAEIMKSVRAEGLEDSKKALARQIFTGRRRFLSRQVLELVRIFGFDDTRLEVAKLAYDSVVDPENFFVVNQAFSFPSTKESLARFIESRRAERSPRRVP